MIPQVFDLKTGGVAQRLQMANEHITCGNGTFRHARSPDRPSDKALPLTASDARVPVRKRRPWLAAHSMPHRLHGGGRSWVDPPDLLLKSSNARTAVPASCGERFDGYVLDAETRA
jgi:hypothetical protein